MSEHLVVSQERFWSVRRAVGLALLAAGLLAMLELGTPFDKPTWDHPVRGLASSVATLAALAGVPWGVRSVRSVYVTAEGVEERHGWSGMRRRRHIPPDRLLEAVAVAVRRGGGTLYVSGFRLRTDDAAEPGWDEPSSCWVAEFSGMAAAVELAQELARVVAPGAPALRRAHEQGDGGAPAPPAAPPPPPPPLSPPTQP